MSRPTIGITSYWTRAAMSHWACDAVLVAQGYVEGVRLAGGRPVVLPADTTWVEEPDDVLDIVDGLLVVGGNDIDPVHYGQERHPMIGTISERRDAVELAVVRRAIERDVPLLGICRGIQVLNVARGGTLDQHLADSMDVTSHRLSDDEFGMHEVHTMPGTVMAGLIGERARVHSHHHQGIDRVGDGLVVSARAADGLVEAIEDPSLRFCVGVLWHPDAECDGHGAPVFKGLVSSAR
ncbi:MAG TPA: gamma-glutamyl-gamma-aminobutyrate hydrolase family protein [Gaiellales bacterium]|nr:gamma-glutamyl-gamma-aminobutyrate hydrolase family protein [Gaiellales bacterium]